MGEAKRKKQAGFDPKQKLHLGCFIDKSHASDAHAVYLGIGRNGGIVDLVHTSSHKDITEACKVLNHCQEILKDFKQNRYRDSFEIQTVWAASLATKLGNYPSDDAEFAVSVEDLDAINKWAAKGNILGVDTLPGGVNVKTLKAPVINKWKIIKNRVAGFKESLYGDPSANHQFFVVTQESVEMSPSVITTYISASHQFFATQNAEMLPIKDVARDKIIAFLPCGRYVSAAYIADFVNKYHKDSLTSEELVRLLDEANVLQGYPSRISQSS